MVSQDVLDYLLAEIPKLGVAADRLVFEITETAAIENYDSAKDFLWEVRRLGCKFSLDDSERVMRLIRTCENCVLIF